MVKFIIGTSKVFSSAEDTEKKNAGTSFWGKDIFKFDGGVEDKASLLKGCSNFVEILTGRKIPVRYAFMSDESFTDGKEITISAKIIPENLDSHIGLALHEASHCVITDFQLLKNFVNKVNVPEKYHNHISFIKDLWNWIEDRRIDNWAYNQAPGFEKYYDALYDRYFFTEEISKVIIDEAEELAEETLGNYGFFIINSMHPCVSMTELKGLTKIKEIINLDWVNRWRSSKDCLKCAYEVFDEIAKHVDLQKEKPFGGMGTGMPPDMEEEEKGSGEKSEQESGDGNGDGVCEGVNDGEKSQRESGVAKVLEVQRKFLSGEIDKITISEAEARGIGMEKNDDDVNMTSHHKGRLRVVCVKHVDETIIKSGIYAIFNKTTQTHQLGWIQQGIQLGKALASRLKLRAEEKVLKIINQKSGQVNKRALYSASFDNERLFYTLKEENYKDISVHISIDMSGSMNGTKWRNTLIAIVALMKATSMIKGIRTQISMRYSQYLVDQKIEEAVVICFYDSAVDKISKLNLLQYIAPEGGTPEGMCYQALGDKIIAPLLKNDTVFINFSDGFPSSYILSEEQVIKITKDSVKNLKKMGMEIISYFISYGDSTPSASAVEKFKNMYGKGAHFINVNSMIALTKSINAAFLKLGK